MPRQDILGNASLKARQDAYRPSGDTVQTRPPQLYISSITLAELRFGAEAKRSRKLHSLISTFVEAVAVVPFDQPAATRVSGRYGSKLGAAAVVRAGTWPR